MTFLEALEQAKKLENLIAATEVASLIIDNNRASILRKRETYFIVANIITDGETLMTSEDVDDFVKNYDVPS